MNNNDMIQKNGDEMSGTEPTGARRRRKTRVAAWLGVAGLCAGGASLVPVGGSTQAAFGDPMSEGMLCSDGAEAAGTRTFNLTAADGYISTPDGNGIYMWGYGEQGGFQYPGPVLCAWEGETIVVNLDNDLPVATSITFPGQEGVLADAAPDGPQADGFDNLVSLAKEAGPGGSVSYSFVASNEGTYLYQSGSDPQLQVDMGLFGAIVIRPAGITITPQDILDIPWEDGGTLGLTNEDAGMDLAEATTAVGSAACAYASSTVPGKCDPHSIYDGSSPEGENILILSQIDPGLHTFMEQNLGAPANLNFKSYPNGYAARYFLINGRSMPDTVAPNNAPWLPYQPMGALAHVQPWDPNVNALDSMVRYVGVGPEGYDFHPHSNHENVIAADGALMKAGANDFTEGKFGIMVAPASTVDATFRWTNQENYSDSDGDRVPVAPPLGPNLQQGDFWSGSPYLGDSGVLNPGILSHTQCGEYYHVAHDHNLPQATNYGATFGGMLTLIKVEPPDAVQAELGPCESIA